MKKFFYFLLNCIIIIFILMFFASISEKRLLNLDKYKGCTIIQKDKDWFFGYTFTFDKFDADGYRHYAKVYQIVYDKYKVGDVIK